MKIHVMHVLYNFGIGGLEKRLAVLLNKMDRDVFSHSVCVFNDNYEAKQYVENEKVRYFTLKKGRGNDLALIFKLRALFAKEKPDIIRTYNWGGVDGIIAACLIGKPVLIHSEHGFNLDEIKIKKRRRIYARKLLLNRADKVIVVGKVSKDWLVNDVRIEKGKVVYIPNGCDLSEFSPQVNDGARTRLGIEKDDFVIGSVGALKGLKDQETLIRAFGEASEGFNNMKLLLVGDGPQRDYLGTLARDLKIEEKVIFAGFMDKVAAAYQCMDIFALPSLSENCPNVILEAMATGLPIIATDVGDIRNMVGGERGGILTGVQDVHATKDAISSFFNNPEIRRKKGEFVRRRAEELFSIETMVEAYEKLFNEVLVEKRTK